MVINPPFAYSEIIPFKKSHRVVLNKPAEAPAFCRTLNALPISFTEFARAARDYPIVFISGDGGKNFGAAIVLGLQSGQNLFVDAAGQWDQSIYLPAYVRRYPFCMARVNVDNVPRKERVVCVEKQALDEAAGEALFDDQGAPLPHWSEMEKFLKEYEADLIRGEEMCGILRDYGLIEPFTMQAVLNRGGEFQLSGMHRVDEKKLEFLTADQLRALIKKGVMGRIYTHLLSLENFTRLLDRSVASPSQKREPSKSRNGQ